MTDSEFFDISEKAKQVKSGPIGRIKYPWQQVPVGKSFVVQKSNISFKTLRSLASKTGKDLGKKFRVVDHEGDVYEVACLPMDEDKAIVTSSGVIEAREKMGENNND